MIIQKLSFAARLAVVLAIVLVFAVATVLACLAVVPVAIGLFAVARLKKTRYFHKEV